MTHLRRFTPTTPRFVLNDEVVPEHSSRGIVGGIEKKSFLSLSTFESSLGSETDEKVLYPYDRRSITVTEFAKKTPS